MAFIPNAGDTTPPVVFPWSFSTQTVNLTGNNAGVFTVTARITDDLSGNAGEGYISSPTQIRFRSPSGNQFTDVMLSGWELISGTPQNGTYQGTGRIAPYSEAGRWTVETLLVADQVGNSRYYTTSELNSMGFDTDIEVTYNGASPAPQPVNTPSGQVPVTPGLVISGNTYSVDNSTTYIDNSVNNTYNTDNSINYNNSFNTDNSVNTYNLSYVTNANDYSIGKTIDGSGKLRGTTTNDLITGSSRKDRLYGNGGNDELIGGGGKDRLYGGDGSNVFNAGTSSSKKDADRLYIQREGNSSTADIIESIGKSDRIYIQGGTGNIDVRNMDGGLGVFDSGVLQAVYTGSRFNANTLEGQIFSS
jgi:hypothetical protein